MSVNFSRPFIFNSILSFFLAGCAFIMVFYAFRDHVQPSKGSLESSFYVSLKPIATALENWLIVLTFIFSEMYGSVVLSLLFWSFSNDICSIEEAQMLYPILNMTGSVSLVVLGVLLAVADPYLAQNKDLFLQLSLGIVVVLGVLVLWIYKYLRVAAQSKPEKKTNLGFIESLKVVFSSSYIANIATSVVCYSFVVNFITIYYKNALSLFWLENTISGVAIESVLMGLCTIIFSLLGSVFLKRWGWTKVCFDLNADRIDHTSLFWCHWNRFSLSASRIR